MSQDEGGQGVGGFMPDEQIEYELHGVKPNEGTLRLVFRRCVNVLTGLNGAGKSTATSAVSRAAGDESADVVPCEGEVARVEGPGVVLKMGQRVSVTGQPTVELGGASRIHELLDPPGKTKKTRDANRGEALLGMYAEPVTPAMVLAVCSGDEKIAAGAQGELERKGLRANPTLADVVGVSKRFAEALAQGQEADAKKHLGAADAAKRREVTIREELAGYERPDGTAEDLAEEVGTQTAALGALDTKRQIRVAKEEEREKAKGLQAGMGRPDVRAAVRKWAECRGRAERLSAELHAAQAKVTELHNEEVSIRAIADKWDERQRILDEPIDGPEADDIETAEKALASLQADAEVLRLYESMDEATLEREDATAQQDVAATKALEFRNKAHATIPEVNKILAKADFGGLLLDADGLAYAGPETAGVLVPFEELSEGQKFRAVLLGVGVKRYPGRMIPIDRRWFWSLDPERMREMLELILGELMLVTELPTETPGVKVVHLDDRWLGSGERAEAWVEAQARAGGGAA